MADKNQDNVAADVAQERLATLRAERAKLVAARECVTVEEQIEQEELALANETAIAKAIADHGVLGKKIAAVETDLGVVIVRRPNHVFYKRFIESGESTTTEFEKLVRPCLVHPDKERFDAMCVEQLGILPRVASAVCVLAGARLKEQAGK